MSERIPKIVLTGGPCAGKTTALEYLSTELPKHGITPIFVPEGATKSITELAIDISELVKDQKAYLEWEKKLFFFVLGLEDEYEQRAQSLPGERKVLILDRGLFDNLAYMPSEEFTACVERSGISYLELRDQRYDAVFHLRSAAIGAAGFYDRNNPARYEDMEQARVTDEKTLNAWLGHPHFRIIANRERVDGRLSQIGIERKMEKLLQEILATLDPERKEIERKYLLHPSFTPSELPAENVGFYIYQAYLKSVVGARRIRTRSQVNPVVSGYDYTYTEKTAGTLVRGEKTEILTLQRSLILGHEFDETTKAICKFRYVFVYEDQVFEYDHIYSPRDLNILEIELSHPDQEVILPPFIGSVQDVTEDPRYTNAALAHGSLVGGPARVE